MKWAQAEDGSWGLVPDDAKGDKEELSSPDEETPDEESQWRIPPGEFGYPGGVR